MNKKEYDLIVGHVVLGEERFTAPCRIRLSDEDAENMLAVGVIARIVEQSSLSTAASTNGDRN